MESLVGATLTQADVGGLVHNPIAVAPIDYAQRVTDSEHRLSRIFVRYPPADAARSQRSRDSPRDRT